ncbi:hypothetical protein Tco_0585280 [Tanacetum coccineum]
MGHAYSRKFTFTMRAKFFYMSLSSELVWIMFPSEADSDRGCIGLAISLPISCSCIGGSGITGESSVAGIAGVVTIVGVYGPLRMHFRKASPFGLVSMYRKKP